MVGDQLSGYACDLLRIEELVYLEQQCECWNRGNESVWFLLCRWQFNSDRIDRTMSMYQLRTHETGLTVVIRDDGAVIPMNEANGDYREYLAWLAEGNEPQEWNPEVE